MYMYPAEFTNIVVINITRYVYLYAFPRSLKNPYQTNIRRNSYY